MTTRDFITLMLTEILQVEKELLVCAPEYHNTVIIKRNKLCDILRKGLGNNAELENAASILSDLRAGEIDREIKSIMGV